MTRKYGLSQIPTYAHTGLRDWTFENQLFFCLPNSVVNDKKNCYTTANNLVKGPDEGSKKVSVNDLTQDLDSPCL